MSSSRSSIDIPLLGAEVLENIDANNTFIVDDCPKQPVCNPNTKFRTPDGSCNNLRQPKYGISGSPLQRILPNKYADGRKCGYHYMYPG